MSFKSLSLFVVFNLIILLACCAGSFLMLDHDMMMDGGLQFHGITLTLALELFALSLLFIFTALISFALLRTSFISSAVWSYLKNVRRAGGFILWNFIAFLFSDGVLNPRPF